MREHLRFQAEVLYEASQDGPMSWAAMADLSGADGNPTLTHTCVALTNWRATGLQSVEIGHKLAAALMATSAEGAFKDDHLPWPAFEIRVPEKLLPTDYGHVHTVFVSSIPDWLPLLYDGNSPSTASVAVVYLDDQTTGHMALQHLSQLAQYETIQPSLKEHDRLRFLEYDLDSETRLRLMVTRLVVGIIMLINQARTDKPDVFPQHPVPPRKHAKEVRPVNRHHVQRPITIDCVNVVKDYVRGMGKGHSPSVSTLVRGHWRQQAHGPKWSLHKTLWIEPHWRGPEGPLAVRTVRLRGRKE